jgi:valyl-tRNA synthetase
MIAEVSASLDKYDFHAAAEVLYRFVWNDFCDRYLEEVKGRLTQDENAPKAVLAHVFDGILRLLHPFAPFITEDIWGRLNSLVPHRGPGDSPGEPLLVRAAWPLPRADWVREDLEKDFGLLHEAISQTRNVRTHHNVPPRQRVRIMIGQTGDTTRVVTQNLDLFQTQTRSDVTFLDASAPAPADAAFFTTGGTSFHIPGVIDREAELARLTKGKEALVRGIASAEGRLGNPDFIRNAPPEVAAGQRERLAEMKAELAAVEKSLEALK